MYGKTSGEMHFYKAVAAVQTEHKVKGYELTRRNSHGIDRLE